MRVLLALVTVLALGACTGGEEPSDAPTTSPTPTASPTAAAPPPPPPRRGSCHDLAYDEAIAPTDESDPVPCARRHTTTTFAVGQLDTLLAGHLLAVDSDRVRAQVARSCPARLAGFIGGTLEDRRLSMLRAVWFTPTVQESDAGASWYRCDVAALAGNDELAPLAGSVAGVLDRPEGRDRYGICGTAEPGSQGFERVICSRRHSWRAIATVPFRPGAYPGVDTVRSAGEGPCRDAGADAAGGALDFRWGYEWPTAEQWRSGQTYGLCWVPG